MATTDQAVKAQPKEKMIEIKVRFFTNDMDTREDYIVQKHGWTNGSVQMDGNKSHDIVPSDPIMFNSLMEIPFAIEKVLVKHKIKLHRVRKMKQYIVK